jgi:hypothetical protein
MAILDLETRRTLDDNINAIFVSLTSLDKESNQKNREQIVSYFNQESQIEELPVSSQGLSSTYRTAMKNDYIVKGLVTKSLAWLEVRKAMNLPLDERKEDSLLLQMMVTIQIHNRNTLEKVSPAVKSQGIFQRTRFMIENLRQQHKTDDTHTFKLK